MNDDDEITESIGMSLDEMQGVIERIQRFFANTPDIVASIASRTRPTTGTNGMQTFGPLGHRPCHSLIPWRIDA